MTLLPPKPLKTARRSSRRKSFAFSKGASLALPGDFKLTDEFKACFAELENTQKNLFITGEAGTGKTTLLKYFRQNSKKNMAVLAPTGIAAINSFGQTIHSFFKFPPAFIQKHHIRKIPTAQKIFSKLELLIIDEASMMRADLMDGVDKALRLNKEKSNAPFGGVQIALFGDLYQLPPIIEKSLSGLYGEFYETPYFFSTHVFTKDKVKFAGFNLKTIHRQEDCVFKSLLNQIRNHSLNEEAFKLLNSRVMPEAAESTEDSITLTPTNARANAINEARLARLNSKEFFYEAEVSGEFDEASYPTEPRLKLKVGAQVLMIRNDKERRWVNGSIGEIVKLKGDTIRVRIAGRVHEVDKSLWEKIRYQYDPEEERIIEEPIGRFEQYPMKLAWAITIHKSQGLTFDKVTVDLDSGAFTHGQVYVALSRCRTLEGLLLKRAVTPRDLIFDERIKQLNNGLVDWIGSEGSNSNGNGVSK